MVYWVLYGLDNCNSVSQAFAFVRRRILSVILPIVPFSFLFVLFDTYYFYKLDSLAELVDIITNKKSHRHLIVTPYNFFKYNSDTNNLRTHGEHPFYQHFIHCFLLFGLNFLIVLLNQIQFISDLFKNFPRQTQITRGSRFRNCYLYLKSLVFYIYTETINSMVAFFIFVFLVPLVVFSMVAHKEARFLLPLLIPVCLLSSHSVFGKQSNVFLRGVWYLFNIIGLIVYGYLHQGGLVPSISHIQKLFTHKSNLNMDQHVIFYHNYMPPRHLMMAPVSVSIINNNYYIYEKKRILYQAEDLEEYLNEDQRKSLQNLVPPKREIYDLMSSSTMNDLDKLVRNIDSMYKVNSSLEITNNLAIFLVAPAIVDKDLLKPNDDCYESENKNKNEKSPMIYYQLFTKFKFHVSFDHLQDHIDLFNCNFKQDNLSINTYRCLIRRCKSMSAIDRFFHSFSLNLYQIIL